MIAPGPRLFGRALGACLAVLASLAARAAEARLEMLSLRESAAGAFEEVAPGTNGPAVFRAATGRDWPAGLVPVYVVRKAAGAELRRTPPKGLEGATDPDFFALPAADEPETAAISGRWDVRAVRGDGSRVLPALDLTCVRGTTSGRFDPTTDYRFAFLEVGSFRTNRLELRVVHIADHFALTAELRDGVLTGGWRNVDDSESGSWHAERANPFTPPESSAPAALIGWRRADGARCWRCEGTSPGPGWTAEPAALCRVWPAR